MIIKINVIIVIVTAILKTIGYHFISLPLYPMEVIFVGNNSDITH